MFLNEPIRGNDLPAKTVCLTFDDGPGDTTSAEDPGPRTLQLAQFLADRNIRATFFMVGKFVEQHRDIVWSVSELGHLIGNHTYDHPNLTSLHDKSRDFAVNQITRTEQLLRDFPAFVRLFRPPQGAWSESLATELNSADETKSYIGPIHWDIPTPQSDDKTADWRFWTNGRSAKECAEAYILDLKATDHGIVLMHDGLYEEAPRSRMYPLQMVQIVVDWLQGNRYQFIALDSVPQVIRAQDS